MKLSKRLNQILQLVEPGYSHIWDCCCDHGLLGTALLNNDAAPNIHFVDIVEPLVSAVESKLQRFYSDTSAAWHVHCLDVATLPLHQYSGKHLVIIAGVGGDLIAQFVQAINQQYPKLDIDFILCPVHHQFTLRHTLSQWNFSLKDEVLVKDNHRFYEVIFVSSQPNPQANISLVGDKIWRATNEEQALLSKEYLDKTLNHYNRIQQGNKKDVALIVESYQSITL
ncbi:tRNA (adenine(22)-N(1))-methyltransferase [Vibrio alfacsensis]|uniref:tRNA (adenine(22)-N(1))-methyltransferase n=1 Tax=Vibrio alfacsensis TaxID=1074311 RepID=UPI0040696B46